MQRAPLINIGVEIKEFDRSSLPRRAGSRPRLRLDKLLSIKCEWVLNLDFGDPSRNRAETQTLFMKGSEAAFTMVAYAANVSQPFPQLTERTSPTIPRGNPLRIHTQHCLGPTTI